MSEQIWVSNLGGALVLGTFVTVGFFGTVGRRYLHQRADNQAKETLVTCKHSERPYFLREMLHANNLAHFVDPNDKERAELRRVIKLYTCAYPAEFNVWRATDLPEMKKRARQNKQLRMA